MPGVGAIAWLALGTGFDLQYWEKRNERSYQVQDGWTCLSVIGKVSVNKQMLK